MAVTLIAGGDGPSAVRLGLAMTLLQCSIGALNDIVDAPRDAGHKAGKPIPAGLVTPRAARVVAAAGGGAGLVLSFAAGPAIGLLAVIVLVIGYAYDLVLKGSVWSWLPFAIGIPVLPVFGWLGATGTVAPGLGLVIPLGFLAGAALAVANARADLARDAAAGTDSVAIRLGDARSWVLQVILLAVVVLAAFSTLAAWTAPAAALAGAAGAGLVIAIGAGLGRDADPSRRERAWELEAIGVALLATAWFAGARLAG